METDTLRKTIIEMGAQPIQDTVAHTINTTAKHTGGWITAVCASLVTAIGDMTNVIQALAAAAAGIYSLILIYLKIRDEIRNAKAKNGK